MTIIKTPCNRKHRLMAKMWLVLASLVAAGAVGMGAFQAHDLEEYLRKADVDSTKIAEKVDNCATAVDYQMYHAFALFVVGLIAWQGPSKLVSIAGGVFCLGLLGFSGGIYVTVFDLAPIHYVIPIGGLLLILAWLLLAAGILLVRRELKSD